ncbi:MAG: hypothetical protein IPP42_25060 [Saprospiraceae bacterium]|nr:hypothetical protein [Saprospiraceae bacterium]
MKALDRLPVPIPSTVMIIKPNSARDWLDRQALLKFRGYIKRAGQYTFDQ